MGSAVVTHGLTCPGGMWNIPGPGIEPVSPAMAGGFLTTGLPGKSQSYVFKQGRRGWPY